MQADLKIVLHFYAIELLRAWDIYVPFVVPPRLSVVLTVERWHASLVCLD